MFIVTTTLHTVFVIA